MYNTDKKSILKQTFKHKKRNILRYNEYYNIQHIYDNLYKQSLNNSKFKNLYNIITSDENILLAYRSIKRNTGSLTPGTNKKTIQYWENQPIEKFLIYIKSRFKNYMPQKVRRVEIPKPNGDKSPLGIPCIEDRIIQQCIKQALEPICEAKFHPHSYGFRPNRGAEHAIAYTYKKINLDKTYFMVDIDIKGFFDNVNHGKLLKQIWSMGICDKKVISIISKMLKAEIEGVGVPTKGVPQGGILSPLLSNIVLNEFDWWISNQWQTYKTKKNYTEIYVKYRHLRKLSNLKEIYIVRYADDFKIFCKTYETACKIYNGVKQWLKERLNLDISEEKSKITDVRKNYSEFLGFKLKVYRKGRKWIVDSHMSDKAKLKAEDTLRNQIKYMQKQTNVKTAYVFNRLVAGLHNYYQIATSITKDFSRIHYNLSYCLKSRLRSIRTNSGSKSNEYYTKYGHYGGQEIYICNTILYPINGIKTKPPMLCNQKITNYTEEGRKIIHTKLGCINKDILNYISKNPVLVRSVEYNDNRLSLYSAQKGRCIITGEPLDEFMEVHHIIPIQNGGTDKYNNLILLTYDAHKLIHVIDIETINYYLNKLKLDKKALRKINKYRMKIGNEIIKSD